MALNLANIRIGFACKERWDDMVGDDQVRDCAKCKRAVFNLSEMTTAAAEAVLARRGVKPCVRFYRRPDGTVMTSDSCATAARPERRRLAVVATTFAGTALAASPAMADPPTDPPADATTDTDATAGSASGSDQIVIETHMMMGLPAIQPPPITMVMGEPIEEMGVIVVRGDEERPTVEWSTWARLGYGMAARSPSLLARTIHPPLGEVDSTWEAALGGEVTLGLANHGNFRIGAWSELRTTSGPVVGGELVLEGLPPRPYDSAINGTGTIVLRAGANEHVATWALGFGYVGSFPRFDPWVSWARHVVGARIVASTTYSLDNPHDWSTTIGIELEPIGVLEKALGLDHD
ncbi:MAG TPA: hypothetical protein VIV58_29715 [Kofleriaceae bacterium]